MIVDLSKTEVFKFNDIEFSALVLWLQAAGKLIARKLCEEKTTAANELFTRQFADDGFARFMKSVQHSPLPSSNRLPPTRSLGQHANHYIDVRSSTRHLNEWSADLSVRITQELNLDPVFHLPPALWQIAGERAWLDNAFRMELAFWVEKTFARRVLFRVAENDQERDMRTVTFSPNTFWMLLAITCACSPIDGLRVPKRTIEAFCRIVEDKQLGRAPGYATLWDQWLLLEAVYWLRQKRVRIPTSIRQAVALLPLRHLDTQYTGPESDLAAPDWQQNIPDWFSNWFKMHRQSDLGV